MSALPPAPSRALRGYAPLAALLVAFAAITTFVPSTGREELAVTGSEPTQRIESTDGATPLAADDVAGPSTSVAGGAAVGTAGPAAPGTTAACPDRTEQVPGDPYSPPCRTFSGDNGGATSRGVTGDKIVVSFRFTDNSALTSAISSSVDNRVQINDTAEDIRRTVEALVEYFNRSFQLYGRQIDLHWFEGKGSFQNELQDQGQAEAGADAVRAAEEIGAFVEANGSSAPYSDALARRGVIAMGIENMPESWMQERHPYIYGPFSCTTAAHLLAEYANRRLFGHPAAWAGDPFTGAPRKVGIIAPENSYIQDCVDTLQADLEAAGNQLASRQTYALNINTASQDTSAIVARLAEEGITTVLCFTDPVSPVFYTAKAEQQGYRPEWIVAGTAGTDTDFAGQQYSQAQWQRAFGLRTVGDPFPLEAGFGYQAFKSVRPDEEPALFYVEPIYKGLYQLALGLQLAGPNLTPESFAAGWQSYAGGTGVWGGWQGQAGSHTLLRDAREVWWNPDAVSGSNGAPGAYISTGPRYATGAWPAGEPAVFR